jgi:hypothetical protein
MATPLRAATATPNTSVGKNHAQSKNNTWKIATPGAFFSADIDSEKCWRQRGCFNMLLVYFQLQMTTCFGAWYVCFNCSKEKRAGFLLIRMQQSYYYYGLSRGKSALWRNLKIARRVFKHNLF